MYKVDIALIKRTLSAIMDINAGERALIVHDEYAAEMADIIEKALKQSNILTASYKIPENLRPLKNVPACLETKIQELKPDLCFNLLKGIGEETPFRISLFKMETKTGAKVGHSPDITIDMLANPMSADFSQIQQKAKKLISRFKNTESLKVSTSKGTSINLSIKGRSWESDVEIKKGKMGNLPAGEIWIAPVEESVSGTVVVDGSIGDIGHVKRDLVIKVSEGKITSIESKDTSMLKRVKQLLKVDENAKLAGEFGIGINPGARITGVLLEDEKADRTAHIAFGYNIEMGGKNDSLTHRDFLFKNPTITAIDSRGKEMIVIKEGVIV